jgi:hypothetical protein
VSSPDFKSPFEHDCNSITTSCTFCGYGNDLLILKMVPNQNMWVLTNVGMVYRLHSNFNLNININMKILDQSNMVCLSYYS